MLNFKLRLLLLKRDVWASTSRTTILWIIKFGNPELRETIHKVLRKHDADFLTNVVLYTRTWSFFTMFGQTGFIVKGDAWQNGTAEPSEAGFRDVVRPEQEYVLVKISNTVGFKVVESETGQK